MTNARASSSFRSPNHRSLAGISNLKFVLSFKVSVLSHLTRHPSSMHHVLSIPRSNATCHAQIPVHRADPTGNGLLFCLLISHFSKLRKQTNQLLLLRDTQEVSSRAGCQCHVLCPGISVGWSVNVIYTSVWKAFYTLARLNQRTFIVHTRSVIRRIH